jgi:16S rRNA (uracil1498-N3)-methyltransferase
MPQDSAHLFIFIIDKAKPGETEAIVSGSEHHHLSRVLKIASGQEVFLTDGRGEMYRGRVRDVGRERTLVDIVAPHPVKAPARQITLALGRIRKDRFELAVEQCSELGVARFVPFHSQKCHHHPYSSHFMDRLKRIAQATIKQSFQAKIPVIESERDFDGLLELVEQADVAVVGERGAPAPATPPCNASVLLVVGPEGGFLPDEREALTRSGALFAAVASTRLRSETAAVSLTSQLLLVSD